MKNSRTLNGKRGYQEELKERDLCIFYVVEKFKMQELTIERERETGGGVIPYESRALTLDPVHFFI